MRARFDEENTMTDKPIPEKLNIKKYSNRRFYDTTRSCHVTMTQMYDLIHEGWELEIHDAKSGDDITNVVLTQILLERDAPKLDMFPAPVLHQMIRTQQEMLGNVLEQFFAQVLATQQASQAQWNQFLQNTLGRAAQMTSNPLDWTRNMMSAFNPAAASSAPNGREPERKSADSEVEALREQVSSLTKLVEKLASDKN